MREQTENTTELKQTTKMINSLLISKLSASKVKQELNLRLFQVSLRAKKTKQNKKENLKQVTSPTKWK